VNGESSTLVKNRMVAADPRYWAQPTVIWVGRNDISVPTTIKANIAAMIAVLTTTNYLVIGVTPRTGAGEGLGEANYARLTTLNSDLATLYSSRFLDMKAYLQGFGDGSANDNADLAADLIPRSLMNADGLHFNNVAATTNPIIAARIKALMSLP